MLFTDTRPDGLPNCAAGIVFRIGRLRCAETVLLFLLSTVFCLGATIIKNVTCSPLHPRTGQMEVSVDIKTETNDAPARLAGIVVDRITGRSLGRATLRGCPAEPLVSGQYRVIWDALSDAAFRPLNQVELRLFAEPIPEGKEEEVTVAEEKERPDLLYYCTFDDAASITAPAAGPGGEFFGGEFVPGRKGNALLVKARTPAAEIRFPVGLMQPQGRIEFWAKIPGATKETRYPDGGNPTFFAMEVGPWVNTYVKYTANDGIGTGGLHCQLPGETYISSLPSWSGSATYPDFLGDPAAWHHYALVWSENGLDDASEALGRRVISALYVDGRLVNPAYGNHGPDRAANLKKEFSTCSVLLSFPFVRGRDDPRQCQVDYVIDEFKIWKSAKTEFDLMDSLVEQTKTPVGKVSQRILFHCSMDSMDAVRSCGGSAGQVSFVPGVSGHAMHIKGGAPVIFPMKGTIPDLGRGCVDFWARISNEGRMELLPEAELNLVRLRRVGERDNIYFRIVYTANDGQAHGGLVGQMADNVIAATQSFGTFSADTIVGGAASDWHRYTVSWDAHGIDGTPDTLAVYVDGRKIAATQGVPNMQEVWNRKDYVLFVGETRDDQVSVEIDELRYWDHAIVPDPLESGMGLVEQ